MFKFLRVAAFLSLFSTAALAEVHTINPVNDGSIYSCDGCFTGIDETGYLIAGGNFQGIIKYAAPSIPKSILSAYLVVTAYGLPFWAKELEVYGYETNQFELNIADVNTGTYLGNLITPDIFRFGEDIYLDVTSFFTQAQSSSYIAFNLRNTATLGSNNMPTSLEYNYGRPTQLIITTVASVPEPENYALFILGLGLIGFAYQRNSASRS